MKMYGFNEKLKKKIYYLENKQRLLTKQKKYNLENSEQISKYQKIYQDEYRLAHPKPKKIRKIKVIKPKKVKTTRTKTELMLQRYRLKFIKLGLQADLTLEDYLNIFNYFENTCCFCKNQENISIGYIKSYSRRGKFTYGNVVCICPKCRSSKKGMNLNEWMNMEFIKKEYPEKINKLYEYMRLGK